MRVVIVGVGKIGQYMVHSLVAEDHDVVVVDNDVKVVEEITNQYDVMAVCGNGVDWETLEEAGVAQAELVAAVTDSDEKNMLSCFMARKLGAKHTIARIRNPEYNDNSLGFIKEQLGLSMAINPEQLAAEEIYNLLKLPSAVKVEYFSRRNFEMVELKLPPDSPLDGMKLSDMRQEYKGQYLVCIVQRGDKGYIPDGSFVLKAGDRIGISATRSEIIRLFKVLGERRKQVRSVMILGGSRTAFYLAKMLLAAGNQVKIIERDREICRELCDALPKAVVLQGDGAQQELLMEEGLEQQDAFVALTGIDEENILMSIFAVTHKVPKVISKVNRDEMGRLAEKMQLDCIVSPRKLVSDIIVRYARALHNSEGSNIEVLYHLMDGYAEALEFHVNEGSPVIGTPLRDLKTKPGTLIAGIIRDRKALIPSGNDMIMAEDNVVIIGRSGRITDVADILE
ncbi:MAG: Trk system potassium transporter TrkA [Clostridia bacterium]|nr:Trk system potassium transporter TrkA [Clostridia bacterium]